MICCDVGSTICGDVGRGICDDVACGAEVAGLSNRWVKCKIWQLLV